MKVTFLNNTKHGQQAWKKGDSVDLSDDLAMYFCDHGWAESEDYIASPKGDGPVTLSIDSALHQGG